MCEKLLAHASPLDLYAEEIDPKSGRHLGNFPQAFTHLALINAVMHVIHVEEGERIGELQLGHGRDTSLSVTSGQIEMRGWNDER